jgi:hypothetical protein
MQPTISTHRRWPYRGGLLAGALLLLGACDLTAPSPLPTQIVVFEHANFQGRSLAVTTDIADLGELHGPCNPFSAGDIALAFLFGGPVTNNDTWNDCISSIRVMQGAGAIVYRDSYYDGERLEIHSDISNLQLMWGACKHEGLNDCISSIRILPLR